MFERLRFLSAGESHGPRLNAILEGLPAGLPIDPELINAELARRQRAFGAGARMKIERDRVRISAGVMAGRTTGGPIALEVRNRDWESWKQRNIPPMTIPRPGHVDLGAAVKYGYRELRLGLERASARETAMRVAAGAFCKQLLARFSIEIGGYVRSIGGVAAPLSEDAGAAQHRARFEAALENDLACPVADSYEAMRAEIQACMDGRDTLGGIFEVFALGVPPGLGSHVHYERRLDARLAMAMMSIPAVKGVAFGAAFENASKRGSEVHDEIFKDESGLLVRETNRSGGVEGGITTGAPLVLRIAKKPIATTLTPLRSVDLASGQPARTRYERSDFCALPRAVPIAEAMLALVLADALLVKLGGDSLDELTARFSDLRRGRSEELPMDDAAWRFAYEDSDGDA